MKILVYADGRTAARLRETLPAEAEYCSAPDGESLPPADVIVYGLPLEPAAYDFLHDVRATLPKSRTIVVTPSPVLGEAVQVLRGAENSLAYDYLGTGDTHFDNRLSSLVDDAGVIRYAGFVVRQNERVATYKGEMLPLTPTETAILAAFLSNPRRGMNYQRLALAVHGERMSEDAGSKKLKTHIFELRRKLREVVGRDIIVNRASVGYVLIL